MDVFVMNSTAGEKYPHLYKRKREKERGVRGRTLTK